jgi:hypothetical protein
LSWSAEISLRLLWTCLETNCLHYEPELTDLVLVGFASREGALTSPTVAGQACATEGGCCCCCCCLLFCSNAVKDCPVVVCLEEKILPAVVLGALCDFLFCISSLACLHSRWLEGWSSCPSTAIQLQHVSIGAVLLYSELALCMWPSPYHLERGVACS